MNELIQEWLPRKLGISYQTGILFCMFSLGIVEDSEQDGNPEDFPRKLTWHCIPWHVFPTEMEVVGETTGEAQDGSAGGDGSGKAKEFKPLATLLSDVGVISMCVC
jgi:hypothetical protein